MKISKLVVLPLAALVAPLATFNVQAAKVASQQVGGTGVVSIQLSPSEQAAAAAFATRERVSAARPLPMPVDRGSSAPDAAVMEIESNAGPGGGSPAGLPDVGADAVARAAFAADWAAIDALALEEEADGDLPADLMAGTSQVYDSYDVNVLAALQHLYPHKWSGRLSFKTSPTSGLSYCSATAISGNNIVTAAHCVYDTTLNKWYQNWIFQPAYRNGNVPYGSFAATLCTILTAWVNLSGSYSIASWARHDVAVCTVGKNAAGQTLNGAVGWAGRSWNYPYIQHHFNNGYPWRNYQNVSLPSFPGQYLRTCTAESFQYTTETLGSGCNWGPGISGGGWLRGYKIGVVTGAVNSVNSGLFINAQNLYGARFNSSNIVPLCTARGC